MTSKLVIASKPAFAATLLAGLAWSPVSYATEPPKGIPGVLDPATGTFTARPALQPAAAPVGRFGTVKITAAIFLNSTIPMGQTITCNVSINSFDSSFFNNANASVTATRASASLATCTVSITYIWLVADANTVLNVSVDVDSSPSTGGGPSRHASTSFAPLPVPNGTTSLSANLGL